MEKYKPLIDATITALAEAAKLTDTALDDQGVAAVRAVFEAVFGPVRFGAVPTMQQARDVVAAAPEALPIWVVPLVLKVIEIVISRWGK